MDNTRTSTVAAVASAWLESISAREVDREWRRELVQLFGVAAQLGLVLWAMYTFRLEASFGLPRILPLIFVGFLVNAVLPAHLRRGFVLLLSLAAIGVVFGVEYGVGLIGLGVGLVAICHLPIPFGARVGLLVVAGAVLAGLRAEWIPTPFGRMPRLPELVLPILGSMFMFRLIVYMYDLRHETQPATLAERLGYFFLLPNICFPLFPVVDYRTYRRTYYDRPGLEIYEKGVRWIFRGMLHLLLYRVIYLYFIPSPAEVQTLGGVVQAMLTTYLLYLRISGQFHLIVGILCLFGYNLPETHKLYFLASSFNDYWRRINIYWKDFMMKLFYYPSLMRVRKLGVNTAMVLATIVVFAGTWLLHSYQWFWLRGTFPLRATDALFWGILGALVVANSLYEVTRGRKRTLGKQPWTLRGSLVHSLKTLAMFVTITVLWSLWSSATVGEWLSLVSAAGNSGPAEYGLLLLVLLALVGVGVLMQYVTARGWTPAPSSPGARPPRWSGALVSATAVALVVIGAPRMQPLLAAPTAGLVVSLQENRLNQRDTELLERGYYEGLLDPGGYTSALERVQALAERPDDWGGAGRVSRLTRPREDIVDYEMVPLYEGLVKQAQLRTNEWGMRDRAYSQEKLPGVYRIALLGSSYEAGAGVLDHQTYENVVEDRLNRENAGQSYDQYEILNFSAAGYSLLHNFVNADRRVFAFEPDLVLYALHSAEVGGRLRSHLRILVQKAYPIPYPELRAIIRRTGATAEMSEGDIERRLQPVLDEVARWSLTQLAARCREHGIPCVAVLVPMTDETNGMNPERVGELNDLARQAGFLTFNIDGAYGDHPESAIYLGPWDAHPNVLGHQLLADHLYQVLTEHNDALKLGLTASPRTGATTDVSSTH